MDNKEKREFVNEREIDDEDRMENDIDESSSSTMTEDSRRSGNETGLTERLTDVLVEDGDSDLLLQHSCDQEDNVMQWLQALDMQVMGACRADERLKPLLKLNVSNGVAEDHLLAHLSQHFEPSEVAMLARCLCIPLVSIRVGKINKQGTLLCPTNTRGNLTLALLPTSNLRISFIGDDGRIKRLSTISSSPDCSSVEIEEIPADRSGRSFMLKIAGSENHYYWCSEKSKLLGDELLRKLKDLLVKKPSLAELTGISQSRLGCFATHFRSHLGGSTFTKTQASSVFAVTFASDMPDAQFVSSSSKPSRPRHSGSQGVKPNSVYQGSLSPRPSSFKEGPPRNISTLKSVSREKFRRRGEAHLSFIDNLSNTSPNNTDESSSNQSKTKLSEYNDNETLQFPSSSFLDSLGKFPNPPLSEILPMSSSLLSPYYCWCPPVASSLQYTMAPQHLPMSSTEAFTLPPLSSLLSTSSPSSLLATKAPLNNLSDFPTLDPFMPDPLVRLPLSLPPSQQIATFTPLMCDPIVHIPVIDICSSGQGYLVSAGPSISTTVPSLHQAIMNPESDSILENGARETLRLLLSSSSSQNSSQLMSVFTPSVLTKNAENQGMLVAGNTRGIYDGASDVGAIASSIAAMGLVSLSERAGGGNSVFSRCLSQGDMIDQLENPGGSRLDDEGSNFSNLGEERGGLIE